MKKDDIGLSDILVFAAIGFGILSFLVFGIDLAYAEDLVNAAEIETIDDGIDAIWAGLVGALLWFLKTPQDWIRERKNGTNGGNPSIAQVALDSIRAHEIACEEYRKEQREETRRLHGRIDEQNKTMADIAADVAYLRGKAEGTTG